jgi:hypothetical protein
MTTPLRHLTRHNLVAAIFHAGFSANPGGERDLYRRESAGNLATKITPTRGRSARRLRAAVLTLRYRKFPDSACRRLAVAAAFLCFCAAMDTR